MDLKTRETWEEKLEKAGWERTLLSYGVLWRDPDTKKEFGFRGAIKKYSEKVRN